MTSPLLLSYGRQLDELVGFIAKEWRPDSPEAMFALHVFDSAGEVGPVPARPPLAALDGVEVGRAKSL